MPTDHILSTKLAIPTCPIQLVLRPRLLRPGKSPCVILVCAPAGYGKTTLIASWMKNGQTPVAWFSSDADDNDPIRFLKHFVAAIQTQFDGFGKDVADMLESSPPPPIWGLMRSLANQLCNLPEPLCIVLDDLHTVTEPEVLDAINFLIDHHPPQLQLILASRSEPPFSLARIRGQGKLLEYRTKDLRFTPEEAAKFFNHVMQFSLPQDQVETLTTRTEGWVVGLQLAAVSLRDIADKTSFIDNFAGDDRHITDFLFDEVLRSRSDDSQNFLLHTSFLERFNVQLCDAVTQRSDSRAMINEMERANMFILGLDHKRVWYRYHHLFTSLLQARLRIIDPAMINILHRRASQWCSQNNLIPEAINYAIKAGDSEFAIDLMETHGSQLFLHGQINSALVWAQQLPPDLLAKRPFLSLACAWGYLYTDNLAALDRHICTVANCLADQDEAPSATNIDNISNKRSIISQMALLRGCQYANSSNIEGAILQFQETIAYFPPGNALHRAATVSLGICFLVSGELDSAQLLLRQHATIAEAKHNVLIPITAVLGLARIHLLRGQLAAAKQMYEQALQECEDAGWQDFPACGMLHIGLGELAYEMNDLAGAEIKLTHGVEMIAAGMRYINAWGYVLLARTKLAMGSTDNILGPEHELALRKYSFRFVVGLPPISSAIARLWLSQGRLDLVSAWCEAAQLRLDNELSVGREPEYLILARFFIVSGKLTEALDLLKRLWPFAEQGKRLAVMIEILILKAQALEAQRSTCEALAALQQGLDLARNTGFLRIFINAPLFDLLKKLAHGANYTSDAHHMLGYFETSATPGSTHAPLSLLFSKKEKQVIGLIVKTASNKEIAKALFISLNTLNTHMKNIYAKLKVSSRLQAIERLRQLGLS